MGQKQSLPQENSDNKGWLPISMQNSLDNNYSLAPRPTPTLLFANTLNVLPKRKEIASLDDFELLKTV